MDGPGGQALTQETIDEAVACRLAVARIRQEFLNRTDSVYRTYVVRR
jgi:arginine decarboxylase